MRKGQTEAREAGSGSFIQLGSERLSPDDRDTRTTERTDVRGMSEARATRPRDRLDVGVSKSH